MTHQLKRSSTQSLANVSMSCFIPRDLDLFERFEIAAKGSALKRNFCRLVLWRAAVAS